MRRASCCGAGEVMHVNEQRETGEPVMFGGGSGMRDPRARAGGAARALRALPVCGVLACALALLAGAPALAQDPADVLVFHGPADPTTAPGVAAIEALGAERGFTVEATADPAAIDAGALADVSAVVFLNTAGDLLDAEQEGALEAFIDDGGGFVGIGSAAESEPDAEFFDGLIGARPSADSSTDASEQTVVFGDQVHPATEGLPLQADRSDVWYRWIERPTGKVHTVARYHAPGAPAGDGTDVGEADEPISWCRDYAGGRSFYTGMGRTAGSFGDENVRKHLGGAIQWAAGLLRGNCKATIDSSYEGRKIVAAGPVGTGLANTGESHGLVVAPNGWVLYIGRGDCRTDAERGNLLGAAPFGRVLDHASANVGIGCGSVHVWDPAAANGNVNSGVTRAGTLAVYGDGGQGGERTDQEDHKMEYGLLGITVAPDFDETGHIYLQYFPTFNPQSTPPGLPLERRVSKMSQPRISRFTLDLETKQLDLDSEVVIFQYDAQIYSCCHVGGGMGFDSAGNLYVTTGDTNSSQGSDGYSGNNPAAKCPTGPPAQAARTHCGSAHYSYQDARRTAGNTNDYNGKMLRFKPIPGLPGRRRPGARGRLDVHAADRGRSERAEPVRRRGGRRRQDQAGDLRDGPAQPVAALDRPRDGHPVCRVGRTGRRRAERDDGPVDVRERGADRERGQLRLALLHGQRPGLPRPDRERDGPGRPGGDDAARRERSGLRVRRPERGHARLVRLPEPAQRLPEQHRARRVPARDGHRRGRGQGPPGERLVQPREPERRERLPRLPA